MNIFSKNIKTGTKKLTIYIWIFFLIILSSIHGHAMSERPGLATIHQSSSLTIPERQEGTGYLEFIAVGDTGSGNTGQALVADAMSEHASQYSVDLVMMLGDNFYYDGVRSVNDSQWESKFRKVYSQDSLQVPFYAVLGNHDHYGNPDAQVQYTTMPGNSKWKMPSRYYTFTRPIDGSSSVQFFGLDTTPLSEARPGALQQINWLKKELRNSEAKWKVVFGHHPLYSGGVYGDNFEMIKLLEGLFIQYKVDLYLAGHEHDQQLLGPINDVHYIVSGSGSYARQTYRHKLSLYASSELGFTWFRISDDELTTAFINEKGTVRHLHTIKKKTD